MPANGKKVVAVGASAGGVEALIALAESLPGDFEAPVLVVLHVSPTATSILPDILANKGQMPAKHAEHGERAEAGTIYIAPPDRHLLLRNDRIALSRGPRENSFRPAVDPLFRSVAVAYKQNAVGVVLSGTLDDGTAGLLAIDKAGGVSIVQDPKEALYPSMPQSALRHTEVDFCLPVRDIAAQLVKIVSSNGARRPKTDAGELEGIAVEDEMADMDAEALARDDRPGRPSAFSCPDCGGVLWEIDDTGDFTHYRCRVGHAYSPESMLDAQSNQLEEALWSAMKTLEETARLSHRVAERERHLGHEWLVQRFEQRETEARERAEVIRKFFMG